MFCTHCGAQNAEGSKFCTGCGQAIGVSQPAPQQGQPSQQRYQAPPPTQNQVPANEEKLEVWMWIISILFPIVGIIMFFVWRKEKPQKSQQAIIAAGIGVLVYVLLQGS